LEITELSLDLSVNIRLSSSFNVLSIKKCKPLSLASRLKKLYKVIKWFLIFTLFKLVLNCPVSILDISTILNIELSYK
jgi:hypothetical protein